MRKNLRRIIAFDILLNILLCPGCDKKTAQESEQVDQPQMAENRRAQGLDHPLFVVAVNRRYGYINQKGKIAIEPQFDYAGIFSEGLARVMKNQKYGYIDGHGHSVIEPQFENAYRFSEGLAIICDKDKSKYGYIDKTGRIVIDMKFDGAAGFSEGLARVQIRGKGRAKDHYGYIDKTGQYIIDAVFDFVEDFSEGLACVKIDGKIGYINKSGQFVIEPKFSSENALSAGLLSALGVLPSPKSFSEGLAAVNVDGKWGYIDKTGQIVIEPKFDRPGVFSGGLARVTIGKKRGYIRRNGEYAIEPRFFTAGTFHEGLAFVSEDGSKSCCIDETGDVVFELKSGFPKRFYCGLAPVLGRKEHLGYVNRRGKFVWKSSR
jgi:hypothetical protein